MAMNQMYLDAIATHGSSLISHIGLVDENGTELTGGDPAYARVAVAWDGPNSDGLIRPDADLDFNVPAGTTVRGWRGFTASTGGTNHGGEDFDQDVVFNEQGILTLLAADTFIDHNAAAGA